MKKCASILATIVLVVLADYLVKSEDFYRPCQCYMLGTRETLDKESKCNYSNSKCSCLRNVNGVNCDSCKDGCYGIFSGTGCKKCVCDQYGSRNQECNDVTGQCICKENFSGFRCQQCRSKYYRLNKHTCVPCNCDIFGSKNLQCDDSGQCECHDNFTGKQCNQCAKRNQDIKNKCTNCPFCYYSVESKIVILEKDVKNVSTIIENILKNTYPEHQAEIDATNIQLFLEVKQNITIFQNQVNLYVEKLNTSRISQLQQQLDSIKQQFSNMNQYIEKNNAENTKQTHYALKDTIKNVTELLTAWEDALKKAETITNNVHNKNIDLSNIKTEADRVVTAMKLQFHDIKNASIATTTTCNEALESFNEFLEGQNGIEKDIDLLNEHLKNSDLLLKALKESLAVVTQQVKGNHTTSEDLYKKSSEIPSVILVEKYDLAKEKLHNISKVVDSYGLNKNSIVKIISEFAKLLGDSKKRRDEKNKLVKSIEETNNKSRSIITDIEDLISEKRRIINEFNKNINKEKENAIQKITDAAQIQKMIAEVNATTNEQKDFFKENVSEKISASSKLIKDAKDAILKYRPDIAILKNVTGQIVIDVTTDLKDVTTLLDKVKRQNNELQELMKKLKEIRRISNINVKKFAVETARIKEVIQFIKSLPLDEKSLSEAKEEIDKAYKKLEDYEKQKERIDEYNMLIEQYTLVKSELNVLKKQIDSINDLDKCYFVRPIEGPP